MKHDKEIAIGYIKEHPSYLEDLIKGCETLIEGYQHTGLNSCPLCDIVDELDPLFSVNACSFCPWAVFTGGYCPNRIAQVRVAPELPAHKIEAKERVEELKTWIKTLKSWRTNDQQI